MALPAGRYGVTKNQLLKIKKLPMNTIKLIEELAEKFDLLGTAAFKNSTSVVTESSDLVESGAVKDIVGWGNKNLIYTKLSGYNVNSSGLVQTGSTYSLAVAKVEANKEYTVSPRASFTDTNIVFAFFVNEIIKNSVSYNNERTVVSTEDNSYTFTAPIDGYVGIRIDTVDSTIQLEVGSTATAYEPYHVSVEESLEQKADNSVIGTVENGTTASQAYAVGEHFIRNGAFCTVTQAISSGGDLLQGTNYTAGDVATLIPIRKRFRVQLSEVTWLSTEYGYYYGMAYQGMIDTTILSVSLCDWEFSVNILEIMPVIRNNNKDIYMISKTNTYNSSDFVDVVLTYI